MLWVIFWCPEEDVELYIFPFSYSYLFLFKNTKAVPKAVPIYASSQSDDLWLAPQTGHWWFLQRRSASSPKCLMLQTAQTAAQGGKRPFATSVNRAILPSKSGPQSNRIIG